MKKIILFILSIMLVAILAGCGKKADEPVSTTGNTEKTGETGITEKESGTGTTGKQENTTTAAPTAKAAATPTPAAKAVETPTAAATATPTPAPVIPTAEPTPEPDDDDDYEGSSMPSIDDIAGRWIEDISDKDSARTFIINWDYTFEFVNADGTVKNGSVDIVDHFDWVSGDSSYSIILYTPGNYADNFGFNWDPAWRSSQAKTYIEELDAYFVKDPTYDSGDRIEYTEPFTLDSYSRFFSMDTTLFGLSFNEFKQRLFLDDSTKLEDWPWWGQDLKVVYIAEGVETYACFFQKDRFVTVYRDSERGDKDEMYDDAVAHYGEPTETSTYWNGFPAYEWKLKDFRYQQHVETYDDGDHYRQQYFSWDYVE